MPALSGSAWSAAPRPITDVEIEVLNAMLGVEGIEAISIGATAAAPPPRQDDEPAPAPATNGAGHGNAYDAGRGDSGHGYSRRKREAGEPVATYIYTDEQGKPHHRKIRTTTKNFWQSHWQNGRWATGAPKVKYLYGVRRVLDAPPSETVWVAEGEKDANTLTALGLLATTNPGGALKWNSDFTPAQIEHWFKGRRTIYVLEDNDPAGHKHAERVARSLYGLVADIRLVTLRHLPEHSDVSDWLALGHSKGELVARAEAAPKYEPDTVEAFAADDLQTMEFAPMRFVVPGFIAEGLTLFAGKPKIGKSWMLLHAAVAVADAGITLGEIRCEQGDVFYAALEDNPRRLKQRMTKLFGTDPWPSNLYFAFQMKKLADGGLDQIKGWIQKAENPRLIIIDTLKMVRTPARRDQSYYEADYESVKELRDLAAAHNIAIVVVHHLRKAEADDPFDTVSGTLGLTGAVDTIMLLWRDGNGVVLAAKGRDVEEITKAVSFDRETCAWSIIGDAALVRITNEREAVLKALDEAGDEPLGPNQIHAATGMKAVNVRKLLQKMKTDGMVKTVRYGKYALNTAYATAAHAEKASPEPGDAQF
jgi:RecA-family ATPase